MGKINLAQFLPIASDTPASSATLSGYSVALLLTALNYTQGLYNWQGAGDELTQTEIDIIDGVNSQAAYEIMRSNVGQIVMAAWGTAPVGYLACDGATYARVDYPLLYGVLDSVYIIDVDNFSVPDMRERVPIGFEATNYPLNSQGGEAEHTLTVAEMPEHTHIADSHNHTDTGHIHATEVSITTIEDISPGAPVPGSLPSTGFTASASANLTSTVVTIQSSGGDESHNNIQPYTVVRFFMVAL